MRMPWRRSAAIACMALVVAAGVAPARAADADRPLEYPVKAAMLLNFARFAEWPAGSTQAQAASVSICVLGRDPFGTVLDKTVAGRSAASRPVVIRRLGAADDLPGCHVLFVSSSETRQLREIFGRLGDRPVLTVGESEGFARQGGLIGLVLEGDFVRFEVNLDQAQRIQLQLSSKLLALARVVPTTAGR